MSAELVLQKALRARLMATPAVTNLVPAASILDRNERPAPDPSIIIGEGQSIDEGNSVKRKRVTIHMDLHVWKKEASLVGVKAIASELRAAIAAGRLAIEAGFHCVDAYVSTSRFLRDPDGEHSHAVVTVSAMIEETA